jgi:hypothetical protein
LIASLGKYPQEMKSAYERDIYMPMFLGALFTIAELWNQPRCSTMDAGMKKYCKW